MKKNELLESTENLNIAIPFITFNEESKSRIHNLLYDKKWHKII